MNSNRIDHTRVVVGKEIVYKKQGDAIYWIIIDSYTRLILFSRYYF